jgi:hypothetical protein
LGQNALTNLSPVENPKHAFAVAHAFRRQLQRPLAVDARIPAANMPLRVAGITLQDIAALIEPKSRGSFRADCKKTGLQGKTAWIRPKT